MFISDVVNKLRDLFHGVVEHIQDAKEDRLSEHLDALAAKSGESLDWRRSMTDFSKLIGVDGSLKSRAELAKELGHVGQFDGTANQNNWLHDATFKALLSRNRSRRSRRKLHRANRRTPPET